MKIYTFLIWYFSISFVAAMFGIPEPTTALRFNANLSFYGLISCAHITYGAFVQEHSQALQNSIDRGCRTTNILNLWRTKPVFNCFSAIYRKWDFYLRTIYCERKQAIWSRHLRKEPKSELVFELKEPVLQ